MYILPFFIYTNPQVAKSLLDYRYNILENAKKRADELAQQGALFAWRTIDGQQTSAYYPDGTAQIHINADSAYGFQLYESVTGTDEYSALVNNNFYTHKMAQNNLRYAIELADRYNLYEKERIEWTAATDLMYFGYDEKNKITKQDDTLLDLARGPFDKTLKEKYPCCFITIP